MTLCGRLARRNCAEGTVQGSVVKQCLAGDEVCGDRNFRANCV